MERTDDTGFGDIKVIQTKSFGYGVDSVLLAGFAAGETGAAGIAAGSHIADLGTGCGIVAFILKHKLGDAALMGIDVRASAIDMAERACRMNGMTGSVDFVCMDVGKLASYRSGAAEAGESWRGRFDSVVTNPPYFRRTPDEPGAADPDERYVARHETTADINDFISAAAYMLKDGGGLYMVHRPDRLTDIISGMRAHGTEPKELQLVVPSQGRAANIALIHGIKGAGPGLRLLPEIAVRGADGGYTEEIRAVYERNA